MAFPEYADERAREYYTNDFVGTTHGDNGSSYRLSFDTMCDLRPTQVYVLKGNHETCAYCGNRALPLQNSNYDVVGYTCVCKGAMDEQEWRKETSELLHNQQIARQEQLKKAPQCSQEVLEHLARVAAEQFRLDIIGGARRLDNEFPHDVPRFKLTNQLKDSYMGVFK